MLLAVLSGFLLALVAPYLARALGRWAGWGLAVLPAVLFVYFAVWVGRIQGDPRLLDYAWIPSLGVSLSFLVDGLSLLFALIITGVGALVIIYAGAYLRGDPGRERFFGFILMFMASMLGVVLSNNLIALFVFWELTSLSSYFLIGYYHDTPASRKAALQALLVTGAGGLAMLAGFIMLAQLAGSYELDVIFHHAEAIRSHGLYAAAVGLVLLGAFTKSAQFPFHFWLPNAMEAPAPVSTYLHSATMVKAGVFLMARMTPVLGGTALWQAALVGAGATTMLVAAFLTLQQTDLKRLLAYSTVAVLGTLTLLIGIGTEAAGRAMVVFLAAHALYKGALFLVAGIVDHETGSRDVTRLSGLRRALPVTFVGALAAGLSMAGIPLLFGFVGKELLYEATLHSPLAPGLISAVAVLCNASFVLVAGMITLRIFFGPPAPTPRHAHEAPPAMWLGPLVLGLFSLGLGIVPGPFGTALANPAAGAILGHGHPPHAHLALWHGFNPMLVLSGMTLAIGAGLYAGWAAVRSLSRVFDPITRNGPARWYGGVLHGLTTTAYYQTVFLQNGILGRYLLTCVGTLVVLVGWALLSHPIAGLEPVLPQAADVRIHELMLAGMMLVATWMVVHTTSRLAAIAALGVVGYGVAVIFLLFGAPDLAATQFSIETLSVILFVLVLYRLPRLKRLSSTPARLRDAAVAIAAGAMMTTLILIALGVPSDTRLEDWFAEHTFLSGHGRNIVNVILVDFRGFDTMGEITVLSIAALGVFALMRLRLVSREDREGRARMPERAWTRPRLPGRDDATHTHGRPRP